MQSLSAVALLMPAARSTTAAEPEVTVVVLVWASQQVPGIALVFIILLAVIFDLVNIVFVLVSNRFLRQKWAMDFFNSVLKAVPSLASIFGNKLPERSSQPDSDEGETDDKNGYGSAGK